MHSRALSPKNGHLFNSELLKQLQHVNCSMNPRGPSTAAHWQYQAWDGTGGMP